MFGERKVLELAAGSKELDFIESKILILKVLKENTSLEKIKNIFKESYRLQKFLNDCEMYVANPSLLEEVLAELEQTKTDLYNHFFKRRSTIKCKSILFLKVVLKVVSENSLNNLFFRYYCKKTKIRPQRSIAHCSKKKHLCSIQSRSLSVGHRF